MNTLVVDASSPVGHRPPAPPYAVWPTLLAIAGIVIWLTFLLVFFLCCSLVIANSQGLDVRFIHAGSAWREIPAICVYLGTLPMILAVLRRRSGMTFAQLGLRGLRGSDLLTVGAGIACDFMLGFVYQSVLERLGLGDHEQAGFEKFHAAGALDQVSVIVAMCIVAPIVEEVFFRGLLLNAFARWFGVVPGIIVASLLFGAIHGDAILFPALVMLGVIACVVYRRTHNLFAAMLVHAANNLIAVGALLAQH